MDFLTVDWPTDVVAHRDLSRWARWPVHWCISYPESCAYREPFLSFFFVRLKIWEIYRKIFKWRKAGEKIKIRENPLNNRNCDRYAYFKTANSGKVQTKHSRFFDKKTKFENSSVNRLAGNPCGNKAKSPPRCSFVSMRFSFEAIWGLTLIGQGCLMLGLGFGKSVWNVALMEPSTWRHCLLLIGAYLKSVGGIDQALLSAYLTVIRRHYTSNYHLCTKLCNKPLIIRLKLHSISLAPLLKLMYSLVIHSNTCCSHRFHRIIMFYFSCSFQFIPASHENFAQKGSL